jgi:orotidine-5'-phosphate decarboxylase
MTANKRPIIYCAVDTADLNRAAELAKIVGPVTGALKLGLEFFSTFGPAGVEKVRKACPDADIFLDLKFHDIPNTVAQAVKTVSTNLAPKYVNVHASGGVEMLEAAAAACDKPTSLIAVTVLTSLTDAALNKIGFKGDAMHQSIHFSRMAQEAGLAGVVCSPYEVEMIRRESASPDFVLIVPGIRPTGEGTHDQKRVMAPKTAMRKGATHLVIGRPITDTPDPAAAAQTILDEIAAL